MHAALAQKPAHAGKLVHRGLSLLEVLLFCLTLSILLSQAAPAMRELVLRQRLQGAAQTLMVDLQQARGEAVRTGKAVQFRVSTHTSGSCYLLHTGSAGDCHCEDSGNAVCTANGALLKQQWLPQSRTIGVRSNVQSLGFQARQGAVTNTGSIEVRIGDGLGIRHVVSIAGRVRSCAVNGKIAGLPACQA